MAGNTSKVNVIHRIIGAEASELHSPILAEEATWGGQSDFVDEGDKIVYRLLAGPGIIVRIVGGMLKLHA